MFDSEDQILKIFRLARIWLMVRELAIKLTMQLDDVMTQRAQHIRHDQACHGIATVHDHFQGVI